MSMIGISKICTVGPPLRLLCCVWMALILAPPSTLCGAATVSDASWPGFRGPSAMPVSENEKLPLRWSTTENVEWRAEVPGMGWSSPIEAGGMVLVTTATSSTVMKPPQIGTDYSNEYLAELTKQGLSEEEVLRKLTSATRRAQRDRARVSLDRLRAGDGRELWRTARDLASSAHPSRSSWATPFVWRTPARTAIVAPGPSTAVSYDLRGRELWRMSNHSALSAPSPFAYDGHLFLISGVPGDAYRPIAAIRPGASGDLTLEDGATSSEYVHWYDKAAGTYIPTPVAYRGSLWVPYDKGIRICIRFATARDLSRRADRRDAFRNKAHFDIFVR